LLKSKAQAGEKTEAILHVNPLNAGVSFENAVKIDERLRVYSTLAIGFNLSRGDS